MRLDMNAGYASRTAKIADGLEEARKHYLKQLMSGVGAGAAFDYFFSDYFGMGIMYSTYRAKPTSGLPIMKPEREEYS
jgi:hypothetical protein